MLREPRNARRYSQPVELLFREPQTDGYGHASLGEPKVVLKAFASVTQMSSSKAMLTFQQANIVGVDIEMRWTPAAFNCIRWQGHDIAFASKENVGNRNRIMRISGYYQIDNP
jgi:hypothetical protein